MATHVGAAPARGPEAQIIDLGTLGGQGGTANGVNARGQIGHTAPLPAQVRPPARSFGNSITRAFRPEAG
jgi:hypothetical protein